ncbi:hypothetical protein [Escherichia coli]|uniref:hypothetical protein n=1 Tax=Escherichia coli TaxID=562 RepID=UPI003890A63D
MIGELPFYDSFFETLDNDEISIHEGDITDIIFLDDFMCVDYLDYHANIYYYSQSCLLTNKNIGLDFSRCGLNKEIIIEPEREVLNQLIKMKTISAQNKIENIQDEIIPY